MRAGKEIVEAEKEKYVMTVVRRRVVDNIKEKKEEYQGIAERSMAQQGESRPTKSR